MNDNKTLLKIVLLGLVLFMLTFAAWRIVSFSPSEAKEGGVLSAFSSYWDNSERQGNTQAQQISKLKQLKTQEIWNNEDDSPHVTAPELTDAQRLAQSARSASFPDFIPRTLQEAERKNALVRNFNEPAGDTPSLPVSSSALASRDAPSSADLPAAGTPVKVADNTSFSGIAAQNIGDKRSALLSAYLKPNREIETKLNRTLDNLASNLQQAIDKILKPKSKKEQNLEKYRHKEQGTTGEKPQNPFVGIVAQAGQQGDNIVQNVTQAFGNKAGNEMAGLINQFKQEMTSAVNAPNASKQQIAASLRDITQKYQQKISKLAEKQQYDKFLQDRIAQDNAQKQQLNQFYKGELMDELGRILDKAREEELALASQNLPEKEYWDAVLKNNYQKQVDMREAIKKAGQPLDYFNKWQDEQERKRVDEQVKAEEAGLVPSYDSVLSPEHLKSKKETLDTERKDLLRQISDGYGEEATAEIMQTYREYADKMMEISQTPMSDAKRLQEEMKLRQLYNQKISDWQKQPHVRQMAITHSTDKVLSSILNQNPSLANDPQAKAQFEAVARPEIEKTMEQILHVQNDAALSPAQKQARVEKLQKDLERTLSGGGSNQAPVQDYY